MGLDISIKRVILQWSLFEHAHCMFWTLECSVFSHYDWDLSFYNLISTIDSHEEESSTPCSFVQTFEELPFKSKEKRKKKTKKLKSRLEFIAFECELLICKVLCVIREGERERDEETNKERNLHAQIFYFSQTFKFRSKFNESSFNSLTSSAHFPFLRNFQKKWN